MIYEDVEETIEEWKELNPTLRTARMFNIINPQYRDLESINLE